MKLEIRYETEHQILELDHEETEQLRLSLNLSDEELSQKELEVLIQKTWDEQFNRPEYNNWHKFDRHRRITMTEQSDDEEEEEVDTPESVMKAAADDRIFRRDEVEREERESYDAICQWIRETLAKKPHWAEAFIAVRMNGISVNDYAASIGLSDASVVSKWLSRAGKKLRENYANRQI